MQELSFDAKQERYSGFEPPIWTPMELTFTLSEPLTDEQIDALFPIDQLGDDPRWVEAIRKLKETNRRAADGSHRVVSTQVQTVREEV